jgi:hypothetical protein
LLDKFDIEEVEIGNEYDDIEFIDINLSEMNTVPTGYDPDEYEIKGFHCARKLVDFPIRDKLVYFRI